MSLPPSPFLSNAGTDFIPSPSEKLEIRQLILARQERLAQLRAEQEELESFIDSHLKLISPIRQIPADILREIFQRCIPEDRVPAPYARNAPLLFTAVCRSWRQVAISTPNLWSRIHIHFPPLDVSPTTNEFLHKWREGVRTWLRRSGSVPLVLSISGGLSRPKDTINYALLADVAQELLLYAPRWRSLSLRTGNEIGEMLIASTGELSSLEELKGCFNADSLRGVLQRAPSLRKIGLNRLYLDFPIRWNRLTEIVLHPLSWPDDCLSASQAIQIMSSSRTSLRHFTLSIRNEISDVPDTLITLPNLQTLNIEVKGSLSMQPTADSIRVALNQFLNCFTAPRLVEFYLSSTTDLSPPLIMGFLERSECVLRSLVLDFPAKCAELIGFLASMPSLKQLKQTAPGSGVELGSDWHLPGLLFDSLTPSQSQQTINVLCPNLEVLVVRNCPLTYAVPIFGLAEARCAEPSVTRKLRRLQVCFRGNAQDVEGLSRAAGLRKQGLLVQLLASNSLYGKLVTTTPGPDFCDYVHSDALWWPSPNLVPI